MTDGTASSRLALGRAGYWEIRWMPTKDRTRYLSTRTKDRAVAELIHQSWRAKHAPAAPTGDTVAGVLDAYAAAAGARGVQGTQIRVLDPLRAYFGLHAPDALTPAIMLGYRSWRGGVSDGTLRRELGTLAAALAWAGRHRLIARVPSIDLPPSGPPRASFLLEADEAELWDKASQDVGRDGRLSRIGRFVCLALETGARKSAIEGLSWDRVDLSRGMIDFRDPNVRLSLKRRVATPITDRLRPVLERAAAERKTARRWVLDGDGDIRETWARAMNRWGFPGITPHVLRHTRITLLLRAGVSVWDVSGLVGASPIVVVGVYGHHAADARLRAEANRRATAP